MHGWTLPVATNFAGRTSLLLLSTLLDRLTTWFLAQFGHRNFQPFSVASNHPCLATEGAGPARLRRFQPPGHPTWPARTCDDQRPQWRCISMNFSEVRRSPPSRRVYIKSLHIGVTGIQNMFEVYRHDFFLSILKVKLKKSSLPVLPRWSKRLKTARYQHQYQHLPSII